MTKHVVLFIRPKYIKEILKGEKVFDIRKKFPDIK